ncbi:MAG: hypothetical protein PHR28_02445 [candidate division Zixibacteria bacterium]|nr:hypothetical protein [candidate division Zixibacteria bacterium]
MDIKTYIDDLFKYLEAFESGAAEFDTEAFLQTYNGIYTVFQAMREKRDRAVALDQIFLEKIKKVPLNASDLRQIVIQILITYFESEADIDGQSNKSYLYCRDLRPVKRDIAFFENTLAPMLFREGSFNNNHQLNFFLLKEIARYTNKFGTDVRAAAISPEDFNGLSDPMKMLELMRRRLVLGDKLLTDRTTLEFQLQGIGVFGKLGKKNKLLEYYLTQWGYLRTTSFWARFKQGLGRVWGKFKGAFASGRYFRLVITQRSTAYLFYTVLLLFWLFLAIYVPIMWRNYSQHRLQEFQNHATTVQSGGGQ